MKNKIKTGLSVLLMFGFTVIGEAQIGNPAPDFTVTDTHGDTHQLYEYLQNGKKVVLDFFFTTCGPCQYYSPQVNLAYEKYGCNTQDVVFISIDYNDTNAEVLAYDATYNIEYPSISGTQGGGNAVVSQYGIFSFPTFYLIDSSYTIVDVIDPPTLQVFDFRFGMHGIAPAPCLPTQTADLFREHRIRIFPNPAAEGMVHLDLSGFPEGPVDVQLTDAAGFRRLHMQLNNGIPGLLDLPIGSLSAGFYVVSITSGGTDRGITKLWIQ